MSKLLRHFPHFGRKTTKSRTVFVQRKVPEGGSREPNKGRAYLPSRKSLIFLFMAYRSFTISFTLKTKNGYSETKIKLSTGCFNFETFSTKKPLILRLCLLIYSISFQN